MAKTQIQKVTERHRAIAEWLIANPDRTHGECAAEFRLSPTWLSIIINSQIFQDYQTTLNSAILNQTVVPLREKLLGVSHRAVEKLGDAVEVSLDGKFLLDAADRTAKLLGYGANQAGMSNAVVQQNNFYSVDKDTLAQARSRILEVSGAAGDRGEIPALGVRDDLSST